MRRLPLTPDAVLVGAALVWTAGSNGVAVRPATAVVVTVLAVALAAWRWVRGTRVDAPVAWLAGLVAFAAVDSVVQPVPAAQAAWIVASGVVAVALALAVRPRSGARWAGRAVIAAGLLSAGWLILDRLRLGVRPPGPFSLPNPGATLALLALALLPLARGLHRGLRVGAGAVLLGGIVASGTRGALLGVVAVAIAWAAGSRRRSVRLAAVALVGVAVVGAGWRLAVDRDPMRYDRIRLWRVAVATVAAELPLGSGPAGYEDAALAHNFPREGEFARYYRIPSLAESDGLQLLATLGLPGLLLGAGLALSLLRRLRPGGWPVVAALAVTSAVNTQLPIPGVAWTAVLALGAVVRGPRRAARIGTRPWVAAAVGLAVAVPSAVALTWPRPGLVPDASTALDAAAELAAGAGSDRALADAEMAAIEAVQRRPRHALAWRTLGGIRLARAERAGDASLLGPALAAFRRAERENPTDVFAAFGAGRTLLRMGREDEARAELRRAVELEPDFLQAWIELGRLDVASGAVDAGCEAYRRALAAEAAARGVVAISGYERTLTVGDPAALAELGKSCGAVR